MQRQHNTWSKEATLVLKLYVHTNNSQLLNSCTADQGYINSIKNMSSGSGDIP